MVYGNYTELIWKEWDHHAIIPHFKSCKNAIVSDGEYFSNSLGVSEQRLGQIVNKDVIAKWILRKTLKVAPLDVNDGREHERRAELEMAAREVLIAAGYDPAEITDPIRRVQELDFLSGGRRKGKKPLSVRVKTQSVK